jgi:hypothetical protein
MNSRALRGAVAQDRKYLQTNNNFPARGDVPQESDCKPAVAGKPAH